MAGFGAPAAAAAAWRLTHAPLPFGVAAGGGGAVPVDVGRGGMKRCWRTLELAAAEVGLGFVAAATPAPAPEGGSIAGRSPECARNHGRGCGEVSPRRLGVRARARAIARAGGRAPNSGRAWRRIDARRNFFAARSFIAHLLEVQKRARAVNRRLFLARRIFQCLLELL